MFSSLFGELAPSRGSGLEALPGAAALTARPLAARTAAQTTAQTAASGETGGGDGAFGTGGDCAVAHAVDHASDGAVDHAAAQASDGLAEALSLDVVVDASPAAAIRQHFAEHRADLQRASAMVTLLDPSRLWASQVVHALADAAGQPVQRLNLRERATLRTLAVIERTLVPRRQAGALRVYHADIRASAMAQGLAQEEISNALAEGSQLTAVIVGAMQPHALVALLRSLLQATRQPEWRCPQLVFILPPGAAALRQRILEQHWPPQVQARAVAEPLACAASVWNCVLEAWEASQAPQHDAVPPLASPPYPSRAVQPAHPTPAAPAAHRSGQFTVDRRRAATPGLPAHPGQPGADGTPPRRPGVSLSQALTRLLAPLAASDGLLACGIVDLARGDLLASQSRERPATTDLAGLALALCAARQAHQSMAGDAAAPDEILITAGPRQTLLRSLPGEGALGFVAVLDRQQTNLALLRFKLLEAERLLA